MMLWAKIRYNFTEICKCFSMHSSSKKNEFEQTFEAPLVVTGYNVMTTLYVHCVDLKDLKAHKNCILTATTGDFNTI